MIGGGMARPSAVPRRDRRDRHAPDIRAFARSELPGDEAHPLDDAAEAGRDHHQRLAAEPPQRHPVEVVGMGVRQEHGIDATDAAEIDRRAVAPERTESIAQEGVGEEAPSTHLDQDGRVTHPRDADPISHPGRLANPPGHGPSGVAAHAPRRTAPRRRPRPRSR